MDIVILDYLNFREEKRSPGGVVINDVKLTSRAKVRKYVYFIIR